MGLHSALKANRPGSAGPGGGSAFQGPVSLLENTLSLSSLTSNLQPHDLPTMEESQKGGSLGRTQEASTGTCWARCTVSLGCQSSSGVKTLRGKGRRASIIITALQTWESLSSVLCCCGSSAVFPLMLLKGKEFIDVFLCLTYKLCSLWL